MTRVSRAVVTMSVTFCLLLAGAASARAQPVMGAPGCCCVAQGGSYACAEKSQADCLKLQPAAPTYPKLADWKKAWDAAVAASKAQEAKPLQGGWFAESCEKSEARSGCCCFPKATPTAKDPVDCKKVMSEFDCKAECSMLRDGREPSGCSWTVGACQP